MTRDRLLRKFLRERFVLTLKSGETFDGLLERLDRNTVELLDAHLITPDSRRAVIDGRMYVPRGEIKYMQRPDAA